MLSCFPLGPEIYKCCMQEAASTSSAGTAAAEPDSDVQETGSVDDDNAAALDNDADALSEGSMDLELSCLDHDGGIKSMAPQSSPPVCRHIPLQRMVE